MLHDLRYALRALARSRVFTIVAVLSLALGVGANTAIFSLLDQVLLRSLPISRPEELVLFHWPASQMGRGMSDCGETIFSYPLYRDMRDRAGEVFQGVAARTSVPIALGYKGNTDRARAEIVSGNFFEVLGGRAHLGRALTPGDDVTAGGHPVAVLSHGSWTRRFGADPSILNQKVTINGHPMTVIGVMPERFAGLLASQMPDVFVPIAMKREMTPAWDGREDRRTMWLNLFARLRPGTTREEAEARMAAILRPLAEYELTTLKSPSARYRKEFLDAKFELRPAGRGVSNRGSWRTPLIVLMVLVGLVLLIACANVAGLLIARAAGRQRELAVRLSLGASRSALIRQLGVESLILAVAGGIAGLAIATWTTEFLLRFLPGDDLSLLQFHADGRVLAFTCAISLVAALLFGLAPALQASHVDIATVLKRQAANIAAHGGHTRLRKVMVMAQIALSLVLLIAAGLFARSLGNLLSADPGFRTTNLVTFAVDPRLASYDVPRTHQFYSELQRQLTALPGVEGAGAAHPGPFSGDNRGGGVTVEGYRAKEGEDTGASHHYVSAAYFSTLRIPVLAGREFTDRDAFGAPKVGVVNESFVKKYFGSENPLGRHVAIGTGNVPLDIEVVGVVRDNKHGNLREDGKHTLFLPAPQEDNPGGYTFYVRGSAEITAQRIRNVVQQLDPGMPVFGFQTMQMKVDESLFTERLVRALSMAFGVLAAVLSAIGVYGILAYTVARRTSEIGIRVALGAKKTDVLRLIMREVALLSAAGVAAGIAAAFVASRWVESVLYGVKSRDPLIYVAACASLLLVALAAAWIPARRAANISPLSALRYE